MSREIKFRTWHKNKHRMFRVEELDFRYRKAGEKHGLDYFDWQDLEIMQFTGLLDKKGVEIYEGDVVKYYDSTKMWLKSEVIWLGGSWGLTTPENPIALYDFVKDYFYDAEPIPELEVIGNIYENPELLND